MRSDLVSLFKIDPHRSLEAFDALMGDWKGFLISDDYALFRRWDPKMWQACLVHLIRAAKKHSEDHDPDIARWGAPLPRGEGSCLHPQFTHRILHSPPVDVVGSSGYPLLVDALVRVGREPTTGKKCNGLGTLYLRNCP